MHIDQNYLLENESGLGIRIPKGKDPYLVELFVRIQVLKFLSK
jgi:hypothetical protein